MDDKDHSGNSSETSSDDHGGAHNDGTGTSQEDDIEDHSSGESGDNKVGKRNRSEAQGLWGSRLLLVLEANEDFTLPHIFQVDSAGVQVIFRSPPGVQVHFFWLGAQPNWHA